MIELECLGAAKSVTGSKHLLRTSRATVLLDCGLFQGHRHESFEKNKHLPVDAARLDAVVLSHAHIDHSGALPSLFKLGYRGPVFATPATRDLCSPMLMDTAWIMKADAKHIEKLIARGVRKLKPVEPLYDEQEVSGILSRFVGLPYHHPHEIAPGLTLTFLDAGHVLGSAVCVLDIEDAGRSERLAFTGDLGRKHLPILRDPEIPAGVSHLLIESTYGDRLHDPIERMTDALAEVVQRTYARGGKVLIPSFALERAQEIIFALKKLKDQNRLPHLPVYVDSPLTVRLTDIFKLHPECYDKETFALLQDKHALFEFPGLEYVTSVEDSKKITASHEPCIVISASGMCEGGRILHHLQGTIEDDTNTIVIVGYQAENTLGRRLAERRSEIHIYGTTHKLSAEVCVLHGFSAHADQNGLIHFAEAVRTRGPLRKVILIHGEAAAQTALQRLLVDHGFPSVVVPDIEDVIAL